MRFRALLSLVLITAVSAVTAASAAENVVAVVNGSEITARELEMAIDELIPQTTYHGNISEDRRIEFRDRALQNLITLELQSQDARSRGMKPDRAQVKAQMKQARAAFPSSQEYSAWLERTWGAEERLQARVEKLLLAREVREQLTVEPAQMSDKALESYYEQNKDKFREPEKVRIRIISTRDEKKARTALEKLAAGGDFGDLAARLSEDDYRIKGGDIGYVHRGRIYPALEEAAFKMKPGETSGLITAEGYWFVIKVEDRRPERTVPFGEAKANLKKELERKRSIELEQQWMEALRAKSSIVIKPYPQASPAEQQK